jgi:NADH-quinone oxidoreductase subunit B
MPVDLYIAGCMPRPEAVIEGLRQLMDKIKAGDANSWEDYYRRYDYYLGHQQRLFGESWQTPTDIIAEARHYGLVGEHTEGKHTELLKLHQKPLEALEMQLNAGLKVKNS